MIKLHTSKTNHTNIIKRTMTTKSKKPGSAKKPASDTALIRLDKKTIAKLKMKKAKLYVSGEAHTYNSLIEKALNNLN